MSQRLGTIVGALGSSMLVVTLLSGCGEEPVEEQTYVGLQHAAEVIVEQECDRLGERQGDYGYSMEGIPMQMEFKCDNGKAFDIYQMKDGSFRVSRL